MIKTWLTISGIKLYTKIVDTNLRGDDMADRLKSSQVNNLQSMQLIYNEL